MELLESADKLPNNLDYFILSSGSDYRAYEVLKSFSKSGIDVDNTLLIHFEERKINIDSTDSYFDYKNISGVTVSETTGIIKSPISILDFLNKYTFKFDSRVGLDISCFTKPYIYYLLNFFKRKNITNINVFYTEPQSYLFKKGLFKTFRTNSGPISINEIPGYPGKYLRGYKNILVLLLGFDGGLSSEITQDISPELTILVNGFPSYTPKFKDISLIANERLVSDPNIIKKYASANNPFDIYNVLDSIKNADGKNNFLNVAPLGTKPMALGACLFALHNPDVRVVYPLPANYETKYTNECWNSWLYELPLQMN